MAEPITATPAPGGTSDSRPSRADVLARMATLGAAPATEPAAAADPPPDAPPADEATEEPAVDAAEASEAEPAIETDEPAEGDPADPESAKRLAAIQHNEKRMRAQLAKDRADLQAEFEAKYSSARRELEPHMKTLAEYNEARAEAKRNPARLLRTLGYTDADFGYAAEQLFAHSDKAAEDPKWKARAEQARKDRAEQERLDSIQKRLDALDAEKRTAAEQEHIHRETALYVDKMAKAVPAGTAIHALMTAGESDAERAESAEMVRAHLAGIALELLERDGEQPEPSAVVAEAERRENRERKRRGLPPIAKAAAAPKQPPVDPKKPAPAPAKSVPKPAPASAPKPRPTREEILRGMPD